MRAADSRSDDLELARLVGWVRSGSVLFDRTLDRVTDAGLAVPSLLPGWSRAHVAGHLARNADALLNLLTWARTGVETPMYATTDERSQGIAAAARQSSPAIRADVRTTAARLAAALDDLPDRAWGATVRTARGREVAATAVPWMRVREVWVHAVDLGAATTFADVPADLARELLLDAFTGRLPRDDAQRLRVVATDCDLDVTIGSAADTAAITAPALELLPWALGRPDAVTETRGWADLTPWL